MLGDRSGGLGALSSFKIGWLKIKNCLTKNLNDCLSLLQNSVSTNWERILQKHARKVLGSEVKPAMNNCGYCFPGPVFNVSVHSDSPTIYQGEVADLLCIITMDGMPLEPGISANLFHL